MKIALKELRSNIYKNKLLIFGIIMSIFMCFTVLAANMFDENEKELKYSKNLTYNIYSPTNDFEKYELLSKNENISFFQIQYLHPTKSEYLQLNFDDIPIGERILAVREKDYIAQKGNIPNYSSGKKEIAIPTIYALANNIEIGDSINFYNTELKVIGFTDILLNESFVTNTKVMKNINFDIYAFSFKLDEKLTDIERKDMVNDITNLLQSNNVEVSNRGFLPTNQKLIFPLVLIIFLSTLSLVFIFTHVLNTRRKRYFIYRFCGMKKFHLYNILLTELFSKFILSFFISVVCFYLFDLVILRRIFGILRYDLKLSSIILVFAIYLTIMMSFMFLSIRRYFKNSLIESYKEQ